VAAAPPTARLWPLCAFLEAHSDPAAVTAACRLAGDTTGPVRAPLLEPDAAATAELASLVERAVGSARLSTAR
jgi:dihydrodipicolinate synthase/N-acetylneuraminate lyase